MRPHNKKAIDSDWLRARYVNDRLSVREIAQKLGVHLNTVRRHLQANGIDRRTSRESLLIMRGARHPNWRGGRRVERGYVRVRVNTKVVREHRLVAERMLGRPLRPGEVVHHVNGDKTDNRPENLEVLASQSEHMARHREANQ